MPSPYHKCAHPECSKLVNPRATYCRNHFPRTREHIEHQAVTLRGRKHSKATCDKISKARYKKVEVICQNCGKSRMIKPCQFRDGEGKYCSSQCAYAARSGENSPFWQGGAATYQCPQCHKEFERYGSWAANRKNVFCSRSCRSIFNKAHQINTGTKIERMMHQALADAGYVFYPQIALCNVTVADFYLPTFNIAVFCDGDYWHSLPERIGRDTRQTQVLRDNGIIVLRFWERDIKSNIEDCMKQIADSIA